MTTPTRKKTDVNNQELPEQYAAGLSACTTLAELRAHVHAYELAVDAVPIVDGMTDADFPAFVRGLKSKRRGKFAGEAWAKRFMPILMPEPMFTVSRVAHDYHVPFFVALQRIRDVRPELLQVKR